MSRPRCRLGVRRVAPAAAATAGAPALQGMDVDLVATRARRNLVRLAVAGAVQDSLARCTVLDRDLPSRLAIAVLLRLVRLRLRVCVVRRLVRRLHALARRSALVGDRRRGRRGRGHLFRRRILLHVSGCARRVAGRRIGRTRIVLAVSVPVSVPCVRRYGERKDTENEHACARQPQSNPPLPRLSR